MNLHLSSTAEAINSEGFAAGRLVGASRALRIVDRDHESLDPLATAVTPVGHLNGNDIEMCA
jgi:hypothetical protein